MDEKRAMGRAWMEVDEDALLYNYRLAKSLCREDTVFICVVKANAYGLGLRRTVETLGSAGCNWFAVAAPEEAYIVRKAAPEAHILLLGAAGREELPFLIRRDISLTIGTVKNAEEASEAALAVGKRALAHVKLDTGLHRLGFTDVEEAMRIARLPGLEFEGIYSHLALRNRERSIAQEACFTAMADELAVRGLKPPMRHLVDSIGLTRYPQWQMDAVRVGAFLYGNVPVSWERFSEGKNVVTFKARVTRVSWVKKGDGVGYDDTPLSRDTKVATLAAGYIDGYPRALSQKGFVVLHGKKAPVLGLVCMDQMMVDVTDIPETREGDAAVLLGGEVDLREYAELGHLNRNECMGIIGRRVPRVYFRQGKAVCVEAEMDEAKEESAL